MKIYFIASFGDFCKLPIGGGQTAARRLLSTLRALGYDVEAIHRHPPTSNRKYLRAIQFASWTIMDPIMVFVKLIFCSRYDALVLYMGYLGRILVPIECSIAWISRILGFQNILYLAGGGTEKMYDNSNKIVRFFERKILQGYRAVVTEGYENMEFVERISHVKTFYLPNYTEHDFAPLTLPQKPSDRWNILYFGRVTSKKNVLLGLDVFDMICRHFDNVYFTIVGGGPDDYCEKVKYRIGNSPNRIKIKRIGRSSHDELKQILFDHHFFLFPSTEPREGHSNALNEAMSYGLVPIVSKNNFLPSIVGCDDLVANDMTVEAFVSIFIKIINSGNYKTLSQSMYNRVQQNFTQKIIEKRISDIVSFLDDAGK